MKRQGAKIYNLFLKRSKSGTNQAQDEKESGTHCPSPGQSEQRSSFSGLRSSHMLTSAVIFQIQVSYLFGNIQDQRRQLIKTMCSKYKSNMSKTITRHHVNHIYVEDKYKILYCEVPKVGCSNWKRVLLMLSGHASDIEKITHQGTYRDLPLKTLNTFDQAGIMERMANYTKFMFVRDPLERLVSAYRDKFENHNAYYHTLFGRVIISKYRPNASKLALEYGDGVTFLEFVQYLLDMPPSVSKDIHWEAANRLCNPCHIDYDFIGKFENMSEESDVLLRSVGAPPNLKLPNLKDRNPSDEKTSLSITQKYMAQLDSLKRQQLYDLYKLDYLMFNYSKPLQDLH
nr:carbohydrate sulfotransferase 8-like [Nerophis lumbriciformis]